MYWKLKCWNTLNNEETYNLILSTLITSVLESYVIPLVGMMECRTFGRVSVIFLHYIVDIFHVWLRVGLIHVSTLYFPLKKLEVTFF